jgi:hypothetical protein
VSDFRDWFRAEITCPKNVFEKSDIEKIIGMNNKRSVLESRNQEQRNTALDY